MGEDSSNLLISGGWTVAVSTLENSASDLTPGHTGQDQDGPPPLSHPHFYAVAHGEDFGNPARGIAAMVARANGQGRAAQEAVQIAVHQFAEGLFSAPSTLSSGRAAERSLTAINRWLFHQPRDPSQDIDRTVSLSAVMLFNQRVGIVHVGQCVLWRWRKGQIARLTAAHIRHLPDNRVIAARAIGADPDIRLDYMDLAAETGDRFILQTTDSPLDLSDLPDDPKAFVDRLRPTSPDQGGIVVIDIQDVPGIGYDDLAALYGSLPLRPPPKDGDVWDDFEISHTLYRSRWTVLKVARDRQSGAEVLLKIPLPAMLHDKMFRNGFLREVWVGRLVNSPWVSRPIELPADRQTSLYLVMPLYKGESLARRIIHKPALTIVEAIDIVLKLCSGVQSLLNQQIVHRDIKPENVMLSANGGVTLLDLGMAYLPAIDGPLDEGIGGSTHYMAPELFHGETANARTEVFALAVTLYRMICGDYPFSGRDAAPPPPLPRTMPRWLGECLLQALSPDPLARPENPAALARQLEDGLVRGDDDSRLGKRRPRRKWTALDGWRMGTLVFAAAFFLLLTYDLILRK